MITETVIYDHQIREVSRKTKEISFGHVIYEDNDGLHKINLDVCSENFNQSMLCEAKLPFLSSLLSYPFSGNDNLREESRPKREK